jgi:hypothetical protein
LNLISFRVVHYALSNCNPVLMMYYNLHVRLLIVKHYSKSWLTGYEKVFCSVNVEFSPERGSISRVPKYDSSDVFKLILKIRNITL